MSKPISEELKNITKNFGQACAKFISSASGLKYVHKLFPEQKDLAEFQYYIKSRAEKIVSIPAFRESLLVLANDSESIIQFKEAFKNLCEIFISKYSVKWIFTSKKLKNKKGHLMFRRKLLRRIQNPEKFTNLNS